MQYPVKNPFFEALASGCPRAAIAALAVCVKVAHRSGDVWAACRAHRALNGYRGPALADFLNGSHFSAYVDGEGAVDVNALRDHALAFASERERDAARAEAHVRELLRDLRSQLTSDEWAGTVRTRSEARKRLGGPRSRGKGKPVGNGGKRMEADDDTKRAQREQIEQALAKLRSRSLADLREPAEVHPAHERLVAQADTLLRWFAGCAPTDQEAGLAAVKAAAIALGFTGSTGTCASVIGGKACFLVIASAIVDLTPNEHEIGFAALKDAILFSVLHGEAH